MTEMHNGCNLPTLADLVGTGYFTLLEKDSDKVIETPSVAIRAAVASSPQTPAKILSTLAEDPVQRVRFSVATNPATPSSILEQLERDEEPLFSCRVRELDVPLDVLLALMQHRNPYIRMQAELTWEGRDFESKLKDSGNELVAGGDYRLGEMLVESQLAKQMDIDDALIDCCLYKIPLGRALLQTGLISSSMLLAALKQQALIRQGSSLAEDGINKLASWYEKNALH